MESKETPAVSVNPMDPSSIAIEDQLAKIIASARNVAVVAEELLREVSSHQNDNPSSVKLQHRLNVAPRLLAATEQQLESLLAMLRMG